MQNKYISHLKNSQEKLHQESNVAERMYLNDQYTQETDLKMGQRLRSMEKQKMINEQNKYLHNMKNRHKSLNKYGESNFKENPIEFRLRNDYLRKQEQNRVREKDILEYNKNALKMQQMRKEHNREKDKYYSEQFNQFVENQALSKIYIQHIVIVCIN